MNEAINKKTLVDKLNEIPKVVTDAEMDAWWAKMGGGKQNPCEKKESEKRKRMSLVLVRKWPLDLLKSKIERGLGTIDSPAIFDELSQDSISTETIHAASFCTSAEQILTGDTLKLLYGTLLVVKDEVAADMATFEWSNIVGGSLPEEPSTTLFSEQDSQRLIHEIKRIENAHSNVDFRFAGESMRAKALPVKREQEPIGLSRRALKKRRIYRHLASSHT